MQVLKTLKKVAAIGTGVAMLGATLTGAMALDLSEYPAPFVTGGAYDNSNVFVVGAAANAADSIGVADITSAMQFESKTCTTGGGTVTVSGGITEDIPLGMPIANPNSTTLDMELEDDDIDSMWDGEITFQSSNYDTRDVLVLGQSDKYIRLATSLTSSEDDYQTDIVLEADARAVKYYYVFDEVMEPNKTTSSEPLEIKFLGKTLKITSINADDATKFTAQVGTEYFMDVGDSVEVEGKTVTLENVGDGGTVIVNVDGVKKTLSSTAQTVNGIEIKVEDTFYETTKAQRSATLIVGKEATATYKDGDAYTGEDTDSPNWVWNNGNLNSKSATTTYTTQEFTGPYIGIENKFVWNDDSDNPAGVGECIDLPNNYLRICLESLTVKDTDYKTYTFELDTDADLSDAMPDDSTAQSADAVYIHTNQPEGLIVRDAFGVDNLTSEQKTDKVWLWRCGNKSAGDSDALGVYYEDTNSKVLMAGCESLLDLSDDELLQVNYENTKSTDLRMRFNRVSATIVDLTLRPYDSTDLPFDDDNITMRWTHSGLQFSSLGATASSEEASELIWTGSGDTDIGATATAVNIGTKDEDHRTRYGIIIRDPKARGSSDKVVLEIPNNQVMANIVVKGSAAAVAGGAETCTVKEITPLTKLDTEIAGSEANYNLILVGGPCVNNAIAAVSGLGMAKCEDWTM
ncbi:S-layer protein, partial [Candidatus Woesearchaeota archaeon]|nr:S-layer protein [Candidatus Woesearchaeota archaeon]